MPDVPQKPDEVEIDLEFTGGKNRTPTSGYRVLVGLAGGGMGQVFLAESLGMAGFRKLVVIKQLRPSLAKDPEFLTMFLEEARLAARLNHPHVVQTNEVGCDEAGNYFLAMEYLDGQPLSRIARRHRSDTASLLRFNLNVMSSILEGLHYAHELTDFDGRPLRVVHRDVSPHNIFVTYDGTVKLIDFGIAKAVGSEVETQEGVYRGKIRYASPEQIAGDTVDRRTDVFAMGVVLWEALIGKSLWDGKNNVDIARHVVLGEMPDIESVAPDAPPELKAICRRALAHNRDDRYATALEMREAVEAYIGAQGLRMQPRELGRVVAEAFASERAQFKAQLETQLAAAATLPILGRQQGPLTVPVVDTRAGSGSASSAGQNDTGTLTQPVNRSLVLALALALLVVGVLIGVIVANRGNTTPDVPAVQAQPQVAAPPTPSPRPAPAPVSPAPVAAPVPAPDPSPLTVVAPPSPNEPHGTRNRPERKPKKNVSSPPKDVPKDAPPAPRPIDIVKDPEVDIVE